VQTEWKAAFKGALTAVLDPGETAWLKRLVFHGFMIRAAISLVLYFSGMSVLMAPDEDSYTAGGWSLVLYWRNDIFMLPERFHSNEPQGYHYINGVLFYIFGRTEIPIRLLNAFVGAWATRYIYFIAGTLFGIDVARRAAKLFCFFPSIVLWSCLNIRDVWAIGLILLSSWTSLRVALGYSFLGLIQIAGAIWALSTFREYLVFAMAFPPIAAFLVGKRGDFGRNVVIAALAAVVVTILLSSGVVHEQTRAKMSLETVAVMRQNLSTGGSAYYKEADISTPAGAISFLPVALAYFFFSPFPWQITSVLKVLSLPEMLMVYSLTPAVIRGIRFAIRERLRECLQIFMVTGTLTLTYALLEGNVGTLYRHRAQATGFYLIFGALGREMAVRRSQQASAAGSPIRRAS
jgi:hypothetical protein